uniref:Putative dna demethylase alkbh1 aethina tumida n=1 Tax=Lutzomyia longipalpis TaxID=7200 RepID=A0A1B0CDJ0_LUTLO
MSTNFTEAFKFYKRKNPFPDLSGLVDAHSGQNNESLKPIRCSNAPENVTGFGLLSPEEWKIHELKHHPGLLVIRNPFTPSGQRYWAARCLKDFPKSPNRTNLQTQRLPEDSQKDFWGFFTATDDECVRKKLKSSLRWSTLGYHHDWDNKIYTEEEKHPFPEDLFSLTGILAEILNFPDYRAQAAIVNFYPQGSTLAGHTDHSEIDLEAPLFSISFGQDAIFLIGGTSKDDPATALRLHSGDIVVMSRESRLCYHAVPKILSDSQEIWNAEYFPETTLAAEMDGDLWEKCSRKSFWSPFNEYLRDCRINLNIRQVLSGNATTL